MAASLSDFVRPGRRFTLKGDGTYGTVGGDTIIELDLPERIIYRKGERLGYFGVERAVLDTGNGFILYIQGDKSWLDAGGKRLARFTRAELEAAERDILEVLGSAGIKTIVERR